MGNYTGNSWADTYGLTITWRNIARRHDIVLGSDLYNLPLSLRHTLLTRLETFPGSKANENSETQDRQISTNGGNWYHFLTMTTIKSAVDFEMNKAKANGEVSVTAWVVEQLLQRSADLTGLRGAKVGSGNHRLADWLGYQVGKLLAEKVKV